MTQHSGTAEHVINSALQRGREGKPPELPYITETDPTKAVSLATAVVIGDLRAKMADAHAAGFAKGKRYDDMTDAEIKAAARNIVRSSSSKDEIQRRIRDELGYPYSVSLCIEEPKDATGREARELVRGLGGLVTKNGAMVMGMMHGHDGAISL